MKRFNHILLFILLSSGFTLVAQRNTYSPYSRFGLGDISKNGFEKNRAMGGLALGIRDNNQINYLNPASYTAYDTLSFLFNFGLKSNFTAYQTRDDRITNKNLNVDHLALGFPITKWWKTSFGALPFSSVGYSVIESGYLENNDAIDYIFSGNGGINQLYIGTALSIFKGLSAGVNFSYLFGSIDLSKKVEFPLNSDYTSTEIETRTIVKDFIYQFGIQFQQSFAENYTLTLGTVYNLKTKINAQKKVININIFPGSSYQLNDSTILDPDFIIGKNSSDGFITFPNGLGAGLTFTYKKSILLGFDYYQQDWSNSSFFNEKEPLTSSNSAHAGIEITPNPAVLKGYLYRIHYRAGGYYENSYLKLNGEQLKDYGISFGVGLPLRNTKSSFNIACEMGRRGTMEHNLIIENYLLLSFNVTLHDFWFLKRRFD